MSQESPLFDLKGRTVLVTGSSQGIGFTLARGLARAGAVVVLNGRDEGKLSAASVTLEKEGLRAASSAFDVTDSAAIAEGIGRIEAKVGPVDILVNNAGIQRRARLEEMTEAQWREVIDVNLTSAFLVSRRVAPAMIRRGGGKIINICSLMSEGGRPTTGNYMAAKGGLKMLTKAMTVEWAKHNIQANGIGPGYILSDMTAHLAEKPDFDAWVKMRTPAGRWGTPDDLVGAAVFLSSPASDFVNGQIIYVDGGWLSAL